MVNSSPSSLLYICLNRINKMNVKSSVTAKEVKRKLVEYNSSKEKVKSTQVDILRNFSTSLFFAALCACSATLRS